MFQICPISGVIVVLVVSDGINAKAFAVVTAGVALCKVILIVGGYRSTFGIVGCAAQKPVAVVVVIQNLTVGIGGGDQSLLIVVGVVYGLTVAVGDLIQLIAAIVVIGLDIA